MRVLHSYKVFPPDVVGGITEVIAYIGKGMIPRHESSVLVARSRSWGRRYTFDSIPVEALFSLGTLLSTHIAPSFPFVLTRRSRQAELVALHQPFPLNDIGVALGLPSRTAPTRSPRCSDARFACSWPNRSYAAQDTLRCYSSLHARAGCGGLDCVQALQRGGCCILIRFSPAGAFDGEAFIVDRHEPVRKQNCVIRSHTIQISGPAGGDDLRVAERSLQNLFDAIRETQRPGRIVLIVLSPLEHWY